MRVHGIVMTAGSTSYEVPLLLQRTAVVVVPLRAAHCSCEHGVRGDVRVLVRSIDVVLARTCCVL